MTTINKPISSLRQRMIEDMTLRKLAPKTQSAYIRAVKKFTYFLERSPDSATPEDLRRYQLHLVDKGISSITLNASITGLSFFFKVTLDRADAVTKMSFVHEPREEPVVLQREEGSILLACTGGNKSRAAL